MYLIILKSLHVLFNCIATSDIWSSQSCHFFTPFCFPIWPSCCSRVFSWTCLTSCILQSSQDSDREHNYIGSYWLILIHYNLHETEAESKPQSDPGNIEGFCSHPGMLGQTYDADPTTRTWQSPQMWSTGWDSGISMSNNLLKGYTVIRTILNGQSKCVYVYIMLIYLVPSKPLPVTKEVRELF